MGTFKIAKVTKQGAEISCSTTEAEDKGGVMDEIRARMKTDAKYNAYINNEDDVKISRHDSVIYEQDEDAGKPLHNEACKDLRMTNLQTNACWWKFKGKTLSENAALCKIEECSVKDRFRNAVKKTKSIDLNDLMKLIASAKTKIIKLQNKKPKIVI
jgi:hypothetical protein